jgi:hypothetical protein
MRSLSRNLRIGDILRTDNIKGYGAEFCLYMGAGRGRGLILVQWVGVAKPFEEVFSSDVDERFRLVKLKGINRRSNKIMFRNTWRKEII